MAASHGLNMPPANHRGATRALSRFQTRRRPQTPCNPPLAHLPVHASQGSLAVARQVVMDGHSSIAEQHNASNISDNEYAYQYDHDAPEIDLDDLRLDDVNVEHESGSVAPNGLFSAIGVVSELDAQVTATKREWMTSDVVLEYLLNGSWRLKQSQKRVSAKVWCRYCELCLILCIYCDEIIIEREFKYHKFAIIMKCACMCCV